MTYLSKPQGPARRVHIDQTKSGAEAFVKMILPSETASQILSGPRWIILNAWRPIETIRKDPLAVADATSVPDEDLVVLPRLCQAAKRLKTMSFKPSMSNAINGTTCQTNVRMKSSCLKYSTAIPVARREGHRTHHLATQDQKICHRVKASK